MALGRRGLARTQPRQDPALGQHAAPQRRTGHASGEQMSGGRERSRRGRGGKRRDQVVRRQVKEVHSRSPLVPPPPSLRLAASAVACVPPCVYGGGRPDGSRDALQLELLELALVLLVAGRTREVGMGGSHLGRPTRRRWQVVSGNWRGYTGRKERGRGGRVGRGRTPLPMWCFSASFLGCARGKEGRREGGGEGERRGEAKRVLRASPTTGAGILL